MEVKVVKQILSWNEDVSRDVRRVLEEERICLINVMGSPGAGKTTLLEAVLKKLSGRYRIGVIEGDIAGQIDADRIRDMGYPVVQLQTDGACHIEAMSISHILPMFDLPSLDVLFVENIGNLVCPAEFNIGENFRLALLSVPEGDDKAEKYPLMFQTSDAVVINKADMLPWFDFDMARVEKDVRNLHPDGALFRVSARTGEGMEELTEWMCRRIDAACGKEGCFDR